MRSDSTPNASRRASIGDLVQIVRRPVGDEARQLLAANWASLDASMRVPQQMFGRQGNGCGATIGAMPRCDFACRGCYLSAGANTTPPASVAAIKAQMRALRPILGRAGNLQLTDGEVTLRPVHEVIELLHYAQSLELIPMLMTHGDSFRRRPGLLAQLMTEGNLVEVSIHVDTTQRGRVGDAYRHARTEAALNPLRAEFAEMIRDAERRTGRTLRAATTMTVTRDNIDGVPDVVRWLMHNTDAFRLISFQPIAQVGRTEDGFGGGVSVDALWDRIADGLGVPGGASRTQQMGVWFGHQACNRMVNGFVESTAHQPPVFHALRDSTRDTDVRAVDGFLARFGGVSFRLDDRRAMVWRAMGLLRLAPAFFASVLPGFLRVWLQRAGKGSAARGLWNMLRGTTRLTPLVLVSHHFMSREEIDSPTGRERLAHCVFKVPVHGDLVSMCEVNAMGLRERYYESLTERSVSAVV